MVDEMYDCMIVYINMPEGPSQFRVTDTHIEKVPKRVDEMSQSVTMAMTLRLP